MNDLSIITNATTIASNVTNILASYEPYHDTRTLRKASNKMCYSIQTISNGRQLIKTLDMEGVDLQRAEMLMDAFAVVARNDVIRTLR